MCFPIVTGKKFCELGFFGFVPDFIRDWLKSYSPYVLQQLKDAWPQQEDSQCQLGTFLLSHSAKKFSGGMRIARLAKQSMETDRLLLRMSQSKSIRVIPVIAL